MSAWNSPWAGMVLAVLIGFILVFQGKWKGGSTAISLVALILLGALFPPAAILVGGVVLLTQLLTNPLLISTPPQQWWSKISAALNGQ